MIAISDSALAHFIKLLSDQEEDTCIRIFVSNPGTPNAECGVAYSPIDDARDDDTILEYDGINARVDPKSAPFLEEASIDFETNETGGQLTLKAPNAKVRKVTDDAPLKDRVDYILQSEINPQLASHGGYVTLLDITEDNVAVVSFGGGCQGCAQIDLTVKQGVEATLKERLPELAGVTDNTDHQAGTNPYFA